MKAPFKLVLLTCGSALMGEAGAATIINWDLTNIPTLGSGTVAVPISSGYAHSDYTNIQSSDLNLGSLKWSTGVPSGGSLDTALNLFGWQQTDLSKPASYVGFSLDIGTNSTITIESLSLSNYRNHATNPPSTLTWEYSLDGTNYTQIGQPAALVNPPDYGTTDVMNGQSPLTFQAGESGTVYFRFAATGGASAGANLHINGISMTGTITQIPEPAAGLLLMGGLAAISLFRRKTI